tara:strand:- start:1560 stop:2000 length:441 start_codon:yes stop_codon:yes gene_type:complete
MPIKSFRGKLADEQIETIALHTNNGSIGYKIVKFETMVANPGVTTQQSVVKVFTVKQTATPTSTIDFSDNTLLAASMLQEAANTDRFDSQNIIFDNIVVNQDICLTHKDYNSDEEINYHIELEMIKLSLNENTVATLKDIRNIKSQ